MSVLKSKIFGAVGVVALIGVGILQSGNNEEALAEESAKITAETHLTETSISALSLNHSGTEKPAVENTQADDLSALIGNAIAELGSIDQEESSYINALTGSSKIHGGDADHLNKIDFSTLTILKKRPVETAFELQMDSLVDDLMGTNKPTKKESKQSTDNIRDTQSDGESVAEYIASLSTEANTRKNEVRMITVAAGETLWIIADRAYGDGSLYKKIYKANPHIRNPNMIEVGDVLRVPL